MIIKIIAKGTQLITTVVLTDNNVKPAHSHDRCTWPIFGTGGYLPCRRIVISVQIFVTGVLTVDCR